MPTLRTRASKGSALTHAELDANFKRTVSQKTSAYSIVVSDNRSIIEGNHASTPFTITLGDAATMQAAETGDFEVTITNINAAAVTVARAGTDTIDGAATSIVLEQNDSVTLHVNSAADGYQTLTKNLEAVAASTVTASGNATITGDIVLPEKADHSSTPSAGNGYLWVKDDAPSVLKYTNDAGTDSTISPITGTWTPSLGGTATYTTQTGSYTKIGNVVFFTCQLVVNVIGTGSTTTISGLPFTAASKNYSLSMRNSAAVATAVVSLYPFVVSGGTTITIRSRTAASTADFLNPIFASSTDVDIAGFYEV